MTVIRVIDLESTADLPDGEVIESACWDINARTRSITFAGQSLHPVRSSPPVTRAIHHIAQRDTIGAPPFDPAALLELADHEGVWGFAAHSAQHEQTWIGESVPWICTYKAALRLWPDAPSHSNFGLRYWLEDEGLLICNRELAQPQHRASPDAYVTAHILLAILATGTSGAELLKWSREPAFMTRCPIGEFRGKPWEEVTTSMLEWIMWKARDLSHDIRWNAGREYDRRTEQ